MDTWRLSFFLSGGRHPLGQPFGPDMSIFVGPYAGFFFQYFVGASVTRQHCSFLSRTAFLSAPYKYRGVGVGDIH